MSGALAVAGQVSRTIGTVAAVANNVAGLLGGALGYGAAAAASGLGPWADNLQTASWRGLPFAVRSCVLRAGRKTVEHDYPFRDQVWVEDLGKRARVISFSAFLVGDDVFTQRDAMAAAAETAGPGPLVHPSLGALTATLTEFSAGERADLGRVVELEFSFIQSAQTQALYPSNVISTQSDVLDDVSNSLAATASDFVTDVASAVALGAGIVQGAIGTVLGFVSAVVGTVASVAMLAEDAITLPAAIIGTVLGSSAAVAGLLADAATPGGAVLGLAGNNGRYANTGLIAPLSSDATVETQIQALANSRAAVSAAFLTVLTTALDDPTDLPSAIQAAIAQFQTTVPSPAGQLRLLADLADFQATIQPTTAAIGAAIATFQTNFASLVRRTICAALATASASYQPTSYQDALAQLSTITTILDNESVVAADAGDTDTYLALRSLRAAVALDLLTRGGELPSLITVTTALPMPSLALAYQLYQDATRADDITARVNPINPLFLPTSMQLLSS